MTREATDYSQHEAVIEAARNSMPDPIWFPAKELDEEHCYETQFAERCRIIAEAVAKCVEQHAAQFRKMADERESLLKSLEETHYLNPLESMRVTAEMLTLRMAVNILTPNSSRELYELCAEMRTALTPPAKEASDVRQ